MNSGKDLLSRRACEKCGLGFQPVMFSSGFDRLEACPTKLIHNLGAKVDKSGDHRSLSFVGDCGLVRCAGMERALVLCWLP